MSECFLQVLAIMTVVCAMFMVVGALMYLLIPEIRQEMKDDWNRS